MKNIFIPALLIASVAVVTSCKKKGCTDDEAINFNTEAKKDDGSCEYADLNIPTTYVFKDASGNNTVSYGGQIERLDQLTEMTTYMKSGISNVLSATVLNDMFQNTDDNGGGNFSFTSTKQLKDKCFSTDVSLFEDWIDSLALASVDHAEIATSGQAGTLTSGTSTYLFSSRGLEYTQFIEKGLMGAVFFYQAASVYLGDGKMNVDNETPEDPDGGAYYTAMEHHWDEAFGYFGAPIDFPTNITGIRFWAKYFNNRDAELGCNAEIMNAFLKGRAVIQQKFDLSMRDIEIEKICKVWEKVSAAQAVAYLEAAKGNFGSDNARFLHELSEAYAFILSLKYAPLETRVITYTQIEELLNTNIGDNFWEVTTVDLTNAINTLNGIYGF